MIVLAGGVTKSYQSQIRCILEAISGDVLGPAPLLLDDLESIHDAPSNAIFLSSAEQPWSQFETHFESKEIDYTALAFYLPATKGLAHFLSSGLTPEEAIFAWTSSITDILSFVKNHRRDVALINLEAAVTFPDAFIEFCVNRFRFNGGGDLEYFDPVAPLDDLYGVLANQIVRQDQDVKRLQQELDARAEPISPYSPPDRFDLKSIYQNLKLSTEQFEVVKQELDAVKSEQSEISRERETLEQQYKLLGEHLEEIQSELNEALKENEGLAEAQNILMENLEAVQNDLQKTLAEKEALAKDVVKLKVKQSSLEILIKSKDRENLAALSDLKRVTANFKEEKEKSENFAQKDAIMLEHLLDVQSNADQAHINYVALAAELEELKKVARWREGKAERLAAGFEDDNARAYKRISEIEKSFSWRITRPVRILSRLIKPIRNKTSKDELERVSQSGLFDADWYLTTYPDIANSAIKPVEHFVKYGAYEGRSPGPDFNIRKYTQANPNILIEGVNPFLHYLDSQEFADKKQSDTSDTVSRETDS